MGQTFVYNTGKAEVEEKHFEVEFGVFIDGTLNNKDNSRVRKVVNKEQEHGETATPNEIAKYKEAQKQGFWGSIGNFIMDTTTGSDSEDTSYTNDYSNVARKWECCDKTYRIYIEGMGTDNLQKDSKEGFAFGSGLTGVRAKVRKACQEVSSKIEKEKNKNGVKKLTNITIDAFGFSRGATSARNFVHEINVKKGYKPKKVNIPNGVNVILMEHGSYSEQLYREALVDSDGIEIDEAVLIDGKLPKWGHLGYCLLRDGVLTPKELNDLKISIRVLGLYDTVSSYYEKGSMATYDANGKLVDDEFASKTIQTLRKKFNYYENIKELGLNNLGSVYKPVHFTAKDEHRENFPLTLLPIGVEKHFPGVHCDIGGAYENGPEKKNDLENTNNLSLLDLYKYKQELIDQHWFNKDEIKVALLTVASKKIKTNRKMVRKEYSYIPLHFMEQFCKETIMSEKFIISTEQKYNMENDRILVQAKNYLKRYVFEDGKEWNFMPEEEYQKRKKQRERDQEMKEFMKNIDKFKYPQPVYDNLNPNLYTPKRMLDEVMQKQLEPKRAEDGSIILDEVVVTAYEPQTLLRKLRNGYFHWSASRAGFGLDPNTEPTSSRKRVTYPNRK